MEYNEINEHEKAFDNWTWKSFNDDLTALFLALYFELEYYECTYSILINY